MDRFTQRALHPDTVGIQAHGFDTCIRPSPAGHFLEGFAHVRFFIVDRLGKTFLSSLSKTASKAIDADHTLGAQHKCALHRE